MDLDGSVLHKVEASRSLELSGNLGAAYQEARTALQVAKRSGHPRLLGIAMVALAAVHFRLGHDGRAAALAREALDCLTTEETARVDALLMLGMCGQETDYISAREQYYHSAADLSRQLGYFPGLIRSLHNMSAGVYFIRGEFELAQAMDQEALHLSIERSLSALSWLPLTTLSWMHWITGEPQKAEETLAQLDAVSPSGSLGRGYACCTRANLLVDVGQLDKALPLFERARSIAETTGAPDLNTYVRLGLSRLYRAKEDYPAARAWVGDAYTVASRVGYPFLKAQAQIERGLVFWKEGRDGPWEADFLAAIEELEPLGAHFEQARASLFLAAALHDYQASQAPTAWLKAVARLLTGGFAFFIRQEQTRLYRLAGEFGNDDNPQVREASSAILQRIAQIPLEPLRIRMLGGLDVFQGSRQIPPSALRKRRAGELLALLVWSKRHTLSTEQACEELFPKLEPGSGEVALHHATSMLRQALEPELPSRLPSHYLRVEDGMVSISLPPGSQVDVTDFQAACQAADWELAAQLYQGELLPQLLYSDWTTSPREQLSHRAQQALRELAGQQLQDGHPDRALELCRRLLAMEPWQEQGVWIAMRACQQMGDVAGALRVYRRLERRLQADLGIRPDLEIQQLARKMIRSKSE